MSKVKSLPTTLALRLYIAGMGPNSVRAMANARAVCEEHFASNHELEILDVQWHARRALADGVIVTPTLLKLRPAPVQRIVGDLSDRARVLLTLSAE